jgi:hypothetical protein
MVSSDAKRREVSTMNFETAKVLAVAKFLELHPEASLPDWFDPSVTIGGMKNEEGEWQIDFSLSGRIELRDGEFWEKRHSKNILMRVDKKTGEKRVVINRISEEPSVVVFRVIIDVITSRVFVDSDTDISSLDGNLYEKNDSDFTPSPLGAAKRRV